MKYVPIIALLIASCQLTNFPTFSRLSQEQQELVKPLPFTTNSRTANSPSTWKEIQLVAINKDQLFEAIKSNGKKLSQVVIMTSGCGGTPASIRYIKEVEEKYGNEVATYVLFSDDYAASDNVKKALFNNKYFRQAYIIDNDFGEFRDDDRKKGTAFRNSFCNECKTDIIGVPYDMVFDQQLNIVLHGYPNFNGPLRDVPKDYVGWLLNGGSITVNNNSKR